MRAVALRARSSSRIFGARRSGPVARNTSSRAITIFTGRPVLRDKRNRERLQVDDDLAAEAAADLAGDDLDLRRIHAEDRCTADRARANGPCVEHQTRTLGRPRRRARRRRAARCSPDGPSRVRNSRSTTTSASAKPLPRSPRLQLHSRRRRWSVPFAPGCPLRHQVVVQDRRVGRDRADRCSSRASRTLVDDRDACPPPRGAMSRPTSPRRRRPRGRRRAPCRARAGCRPMSCRSSATSPPSISLRGRSSGCPSPVITAFDARHRFGRRSCRSTRCARGHAGCAATTPCSIPGRREVGAVVGAAGDLVDAVVTDRARADVVETCVSLMQPASLISCGGVENRADDLVVAGASAQIPGQPVPRLAPRSDSGSRPAAPWRRR